MKRTIVLLLAFVSCAIWHNPSAAQVRLPRLISDGMVLQRDSKVKIWGWASQGEAVSIDFKKKTYKTKANKEGDWEITLPAQKAGGPFKITVKGEKNTISLSNILFGDVWLCAGQSNMVHYLELHQDRYAQEIKEAQNPEIRQFLVSSNPVLTGPIEDLPDGEWKEASSENVLKFSAVAYFFAKKIYAKYAVPIGLINASIGGSRIEAWISESGLKSFDDLSAQLIQNKDTAEVFGLNRKAEAFRSDWYANLPEDKGLVAENPWYSADYKSDSWRRMNVPGYWEDQGIKQLNGVVWYRKEVDIPATMAGQPARVALGRIVDADHFYVNGKEIGNTTYLYPQRRYNVPAGLLKEGKNTFVIRVLNYEGKGGLVPDKPYYIASESDTVDLKGYWQYKVGAVYPEKAEEPPSVLLRFQPTVYYYGMVAPYKKLHLKGVLWYQGESNVDKPGSYLDLQKALIDDWRNQFNDEELPFLYVQLPNFLDVNYQPTESSWAEIREAQRKALSMPNTAMAVAIDLGEWNDIHPDRKKPVGDRLALAAQHMAYGDENIVYSGPLIQSAKKEGQKVVLQFDHVGSGLEVNNDEPLKWFAIAGKDKKFVWAQAEISTDQKTLIVWNETVENPEYVRYGWADNPDQVNLYNKEGLPASPFQIEVK
ncbi:sialate O-acetylesterase [Fulvivirga maritima]|uniref:sialate O-acetylesterase n=1 Tax=Fulvivirga maritima TaxID=2904247 RepID=UPI001F229F72|nr:sialate O-acetylesterase [Fulvivirga maritima]UII27293.1 sialate O-acetylesterase [Fulvivirga maritima]